MNTFTEINIELNVVINPENILWNKFILFLCDCHTYCMCHQIFNFLYSINKINRNRDTKYKLKGLS